MVDGISDLHRAIIQFIDKISHTPIMQFDILGSGVNSLSQLFGVYDNDFFFKLLTHTGLVKINKNGLMRINQSSNDVRSWISMMNNNRIEISIFIRQQHDSKRKKYLTVGDCRKDKSTHDSTLDISQHLKRTYLQQIRIIFNIGIQNINDEVKAENTNSVSTNFVINDSNIIQTLPLGDRPNVTYNISSDDTLNNNNIFNNRVNSVIKYPYLKKYKVPLITKELSALMQEIIKYKEMVNETILSRNEIISLNNNKRISVMIIPSSTSFKSFRRNFKRTQWIEKLEEAITSDKAAHNETGIQ